MCNPGCELPNYGVNCSQICECGPGVDRCDSVSGCVCQSGWIGKNCDVDIDECQENPNICSTKMICANNEGSYQCICREGSRLVDDACEDIDECSDETLNDCPPDTTQCLNSFGNYSCDCKPGYQEQGSDCKDIDECQLGIHKCSQYCQNTPGSYNCMCFFGFALREDRMTCEKVKDSCSLYPDLNCTYGCKKINKDKGLCFCESGYELQSDGSCQDTNECLNSSTCDHNCTNEKGSFTCSCAVGHRIGNDGKSCTVCHQDFYGENCRTPCKCGRGSKECDNIKGCVCNPGWRGETCEEDVNECHSSPCTGEHEVCLNTPGSFRCDCVPGFKNYSGTCKDIDECQEPHICHQLCTNTNGSYKCGCKPGYELINSKDCVDIDECDKARCSKCSNWPGSFKCFCSDGYQLNTTTLRECENVDECQENIHNCSINASCTDTDGSFQCSCHRGTQGNGYNCTACFPFTYGEQCSEDCLCEKFNSKKCDAVTGSCQCRTGWTGDTCSRDVDECKEGIRTCNTTLYQICVNDPGSSHCECLYGGKNLANCICPKPSIPINETDVKVKAEVRFDVKASREEFLQHSEEWRFQIEATLREFHRDTVPGFSTLIVLSIRLIGSIVADYEIIGTKIQSIENKFENGVASSMSKILSGEHKFNILDQEAPVIGITVKDNNGSATMSFTTPTSACYLLKAFYECPSGYHCDDSSNKAECVLNDFSDLAIITISIGVCVPLLIAVIVIIIVWKRYQKKALKRKANTSQHERFPMTLAGKIPRPKPTSSSEYDTIDSQALYDSKYTALGRINLNYSADSHREKRHQPYDQKY